MQNHRTAQDESVDNADIPLIDHRQQEAAAKKKKVVRIAIIISIIVVVALAIILPIALGAFKSGDNPDEPFKYQEFNPYKADNQQFTETSASGKINLQSLSA